MESQQGAVIVKRIQDTLGAEWVASEIGFNEPFYFVTIELAGAQPEATPYMLTWDAADEPGLAVGNGFVLGFGSVLGKGTDADGPLDQVLAKVLETWRSRKDKKRWGLFSR